jgi:uncharacterized protein YceH (UPF0502 family)
LLSGNLAPTEFAPARTPSSSSAADDRIASLENEVAELRRELSEMQQQLSAFRKQFE